MGKVIASLQKHIFVFTEISLLFLLVLLMLPTGVSAQTVTAGQITGNVTDPNGAVVADATITLTQVETSAKRTLTTNASGNYTIANLAVGTYRLGITKTGFKETSIANVVVNVANITRQDIVLEVGAVSEVVNITAESVQVETQTGTVGEIISGEQVRELPLNGRSFVQLTQLQPGVAAADSLDSKQKGLFGGVDFSVNGNSAQSNLFLTDGANNNDTGSNRTILLFPSIEAIAEFKSLRNSYGPEFGQAAGAVISIVTRGGSNQFHGSGYFFGRNDSLNAAEFFAKTRTGTKDKLSRKDYGFSLGGPIVKDRLFFFYSQEFNKETRGQARFGSVPTLRERAGDFSQPRRVTLPNGQVQDCSGPQIGNNRPGSTNQIIPQANLSPAGAALVKLFPLPNVTNPTTCNNWAESVNSPINFREENVRIDANLTNKNRIFGRYTRDDWSNGFPILVGNLWGDDAFPTVESSWKQPSFQTAIKLSSTLTSTSVNEIQFAYSANRILIDPGAGSDTNRAINQAVPGFFSDSTKVNGLNRPHPVFWGGIQPFYSSSGPDLWAQIPFRNALDIYSVKDDLSMLKGNHSLKMGFLYDQAGKNEDSGPNNESVQFWGACCENNSGNYLADVLTRGSSFGFAETNKQPVGQTRYKNLEFYFGDSWKAKPNLTLELGTRYSILYEPYDARNLISSFSPAAYNSSRPASDPCNGLVVPKGTNPCQGIAGASTPAQFSNRALRKNGYKNLAPRLGLAWDVFSNGKTAVRAGFGQFFLRERVALTFGGLTLNSPFAATIGGQRTLDGQFSGLSAASNGSPQYGITPEAQSPYALQFNVSFGQQLWKDTVLEVGYVGNRARNQLTHTDVNQVNAANRKAAAFAPDANAVNQFRPFRNYGSIYQFERAGRADYDSLQVLFRTRFSRSFNLQAAYTYSRSLADFGLGDSNGNRSDFAILDRNNRDLDFAESDINRPHIFVANAIYNFPKFDGYNGFVKSAIGGWEVAAIVQSTSGSSITPRLNATSIGGLQAGISGFGSAVANQRPLRVASQPCTIDGPTGRFLNPAAFTLVGYKIGESSPKKSTCSGPSTNNLDFSLFKNFAPSWLKKSVLGEGARLQFRLEFFNAFNTPQFRGDTVGRIFSNGPIACGASACSATNNTITSAPVDGNFGVANRTRGGREVQYAVKFYF